MSSTNSNSNLHTATYIWTIDNFPSVEAKGKSEFSPNFHAAENDKIIWCLQLDPNGKNETKNTVSLYLHLSCHSDDEHSVYATYNAEILSKDGGKFTSKSPQVHEYFEGHYGTSSTSWGWKDFCTKDENFRTNLLINKTLTIRVEVVFSKMLHVVIESLDNISRRSNPHGCDLSENLASLLETQAFSDIVLSTKQKDFAAHKVLLAARSKVFAAMFRHDTKENQLNRIEIEDMSEGTVAEMLRFIYTGRCEKLDELAEELLVAADKYDLNRLKIISGRALLETLSVENASYVLILADTHNAKELKNDVLEFIVSRGSEVLSTAGWRFVLPKSDLVNEVCQALARQLTFERVDNCEYY